MKKKLVLLILMIFVLQGCGIVGEPPVDSGINVDVSSVSAKPLEQSSNNDMRAPPAFSATSTPRRESAVQTIVPITPAINPLTGLPVANADNLKLPPALVSITNWPITARPQAGLSFAPFVFELYIGEGMSRFLALFYGDFPSGASSSGSQSSGNSMVTSDDAQIGPIRSGRLPYEHLRRAYNGFLVMASAYSGVAQNLGEYTNYFGSDTDNINSAMISVTRLEDIARASKFRVQPSSISVMRFDSTIPEGGKAAPRFWFMYNAVSYTHLTLPTIYSV